MVSPLLLVSCVQLVAGAGLRSVGRGKLVLPLAAGCKKGSFRLGPQSHLLLESANLNTAYGDNLDCKNLFVAESGCSLLMQCSDFELEPVKKNGKCAADFLLVKGGDGVKRKYCGADTALRQSVNHGGRLLVRFRTNGKRNGFPGFRCHITCCPQQYLSSSEVQAFKQGPARAGEKLQVCEKPAVDTSASDATCGVQGPVTKIVGGATADKYKYTWLAMLVRRSKRRAGDTGAGPRSSVVPPDMSPFCGGSLVSPRWVVTAAHCTGLGGPLSSYRVVLGEWDRSQVSDTVARVHEVADMIKHPAYNPNTFDSDLAMWRLSTEADLHHFRTICLPEPGMRLHNPMTVAGWGVSREGSSVLATVLQEVTVPVVSSSVCKAKLGDYDITANMLCAGGVKGQDACQGDSGGPLMGLQPDTNQTHLAGVVSWGLGCAREGLYGVYTKVSAYRDWIEGVARS